MSLALYQGLLSRGLLIYQAHRQRQPWVNQRPQTALVPLNLFLGAVAYPRAPHEANTHFTVIAVINIRALSFNLLSDSGDRRRISACFIVGLINNARY